MRKEAVIFDREAVKMAARFRCLFQARVDGERDSLTLCNNSGLSVVWQAQGFADIAACNLTATYLT